MDAVIILDYVIKGLNALIQVTAANVAVNTQLLQLKSELELMQLEGRDPSPAEWDALNARIDAKIESLKS
jgi:hypothetical protein